MIVRTPEYYFYHRFVHLAALLIICFSGCVHIPPETLNRTIDAAELSGHVRFLAQPALRGRNAKTFESAIARHYITSRFKTYGLVPWANTRGYEQDFGLGTNVVGVLPGCDPVLSEQIVLISAHYDHLDQKDGKLYPGAADNASGVAALLELAEQLSLSESRPQRSICFAAFDTEEQGMFGAYAFTCRDDFDASRIAAVVNVDMLGHKTFDVADNTLLVACSASYPQLRKLILQAADLASIRVLPMGSDLMGPGSDHIPFSPFGMPCLFFTSGYFTGYHSPNDTAEKLDYELVRRSGDLIAHIVANLGNAERIPQPVHPAPPDFDELRAIRDLLDETVQQRNALGLTDLELEDVRNVAQQANELLAAGTYTEKDRRRYIWALGPAVVPIIMRFMNAGSTDHGNHHDQKCPLDKKISDTSRLIWREFCATHGDFAINTFRKGMRHYLHHRPGLFRRMPPLDLSAYVLSENDLQYTKLDDNRFRLSLLVWKLLLNISMTCRHVHAYADVHDFSGKPDEVVDYILLCWRPRSTDESFGRVWDSVLERVCSEDHGDTFEDWLTWRLDQTGHEDKEAWRSALRKCDHKELAREAKRFVPTEENLRPDKKTVTYITSQDGHTYLENVGRTDSRKALEAWIKALSFKLPPPDAIEAQCVFDPTFPFYDHPAMRLRRLRTEKMTSQEHLPLNKVAEAKLKELTGQDFGDDAKAWRQWVEANGPKK